MLNVETSDNFSDFTEQQIVEILFFFNHLHITW